MHRQIIKKANSHLSLTIPEEYINKRIEILIFEVDEGLEESTGNYNFSDLSGKLSYSGDAVKDQRNIRDEWK
jgi:hypothetical protein